MELVHTIEAKTIHNLCIFYSRAIPLKIAAHALFASTNADYRVVIENRVKENEKQVVDNKTTNSCC